VLAIQDDLGNWYYFKRQLLWVAAGIGVLIISAKVPYSFYRKWAGPIFAAGMAGLVAVLAIGERRGGSLAWIDLGFTDLQPSEFAKFAVIVPLAAIMEKKEDFLDDFGHFLVPVVATVGIAGVLTMLQPDLGTTLVIAAAAFAVLAVSGAPARYLGLTAVAGGTLGVLLAFSDAERMSRLTAFIDPFADPLDQGYQVVQGLGALGTGGAFGVGLGASRTRWGWVPNAHTDFIFAIIGEEVGFAGGLVVIGLFAGFSILGATIAYRAPDRFGRMLAAGITVWLTSQAIINIGGVAHALPVTGLPLPFVSVGGSAMITAMGAVGVLLSIAARGTSKTAGKRR
jgi:cell division protein FtsW